MDASEAMKPFKSFLNENKLYFDSEDEITESDLQQVYDGVVWTSQHERQNNLGATLFNDLSGSDKIEYFNKFVIPLWKKHKYPIPGKTPYLKFQDELKRSWKKLKMNPKLDYYDPKVIRKTLGLK